MCTGPHPQQKPGKVPAAAHMGPSPVIPNSTVQANQHSNLPNHYCITPPTGSPYLLPFPHFTPSPTTLRGRGCRISFYFFTYGKYTCIPNTPHLLIYNKSYPSTILVSFIILFVSLTFLSDLMKQLQYGCQQKLVNDFIMILLCFSTTSFILL